MSSRFTALLLAGLLVLGVAACDSSTEADTEGQVDTDLGTPADGEVEGDLDTEVE